MLAVFKREFKSYFTTPIGFVILAVFTFFEGMFFNAIYNQGAPSEDRRQKVDQALLTAPVKVSAIVMGKFLAALALFALGFALTLVFQLVVTTLVTVNWLIYLYALLGILLLGSVMISIGMYISSLTESPIISAALTIGIFMAVMFLGSYAGSINAAWLQTVASAISFIDRFNNFTGGILNPVDIVYMVSVSALFIFLTVRSVEKRRWA